MKQNVGDLDRALRIIAGLVLILLGFIYKKWMIVLGAVVLLTGLFRLCLLYKPFGISTNCCGDSGKNTDRSSGCGCGN